MEVPFSPPLISEDEIAEVVDTLRSGWITTGPKTKIFENDLTDYCSTDKTVCLNSATAALEMTLRVLGIGKGDEIITTAYTYTASASVVNHIGATLKLVDCRKEDYLIDYTKIEEQITDKTKAIIPVDVGGVPCDYDKIYEIINKNIEKFVPSNDIQAAIGRIAIITDGAHSLGAIYKNKKACTFSDFTSFSFHAVKNLTTGEGGAVTFKNINGVDTNLLYKQYQLLSLHGQSKDALAKTQKGAWEYDIIAPYFKCNMTDIMASIGLQQLKKYDSYLIHRHSVFDKYNAAFEDLPLILPKDKGSDFISSAHLYLLRFKKDDINYRNKFIVKMAEKSVNCNVHYKPLPMLTAYKNLGFNIKDYPTAYNNFINEISLPVFNAMTDEQTEYVIKTFKDVLEEM